MIVRSAFTKAIPFDKNWRELYMTTERKENWFYRLLIRLRIRKPRRTMVPGVYPKLFESGLQKEFEAAYSIGFISSKPDQGAFMCGNCSLISSDMNEIIDHECPGPPPKPEHDEPDYCPECGREYEDEDV